MVLRRFGTRLSTNTPTPVVSQGKITHGIDATKNKLNDCQSQSPVYSKEAQNQAPASPSLSALKRVKVRRSSSNNGSSGSDSGEGSFKDGSRKYDSKNKQKSITFLAGPVGMELEPNIPSDDDHEHCPARVVRFVDGGPQQPGQARKAGDIQPGDYIVQAQAASAIGTTYDGIIQVLKMTDSVRELTVLPVSEDVSIEGNRNGTLNLQSPTFDETREDLYSKRPGRTQSREKSSTKNSSVKRLAKTKKDKAKPKQPKTKTKSVNDDSSGPLIIPIRGGMPVSPMISIVEENECGEDGSTNTSIQDSCSSVNSLSQHSSPESASSLTMPLESRFSVASPHRLTFVEDESSSSISAYSLDSTHSSKLKNGGNDIVVDKVHSVSFSPSNVRKLTTVHKGLKVKPKTLSNAIGAVIHSFVSPRTSEPGTPQTGSESVHTPKRSNASPQSSLSISQSASPSYRDPKVELMSELSQAKAALEVQNESHQNWNANMERLFRENAELHQQFEEKLHLARLEHTKTEQELKAYYSKMCELKESRIRELEAINDKLKEQLYVVEQQQQHSPNRVKSIETQTDDQPIQVHKNENNNHHRRIAESLKEKVGALASSLEERKIEVDTLQKEKNLKESELESEIMELQTENTRLHEDQMSLRLQIDLCKCSQLDGVLEDLELAKAEKHAAEKQAEGLQTELSNTRQELQSVQDMLLDRAESQMNSVLLSPNNSREMMEREESVICCNNNTSVCGEESIASPNQNESINSDMENIGQSQSQMFGIASEFREGLSSIELMLLKLQKRLVLSDIQKRGFIAEHAESRQIYDGKLQKSAQEIESLKKSCENTRKQLQTMELQLGESIFNSDQSLFVAQKRSVLIEIEKNHLSSINKSLIVQLGDEREKSIALSISESNLYLRLLKANKSLSMAWETIHALEDARVASAKDFDNFSNDLFDVNSEKQELESAFFVALQDLTSLKANETALQSRLNEAQTHIGDLELAQHEASAKLDVMEMMNASLLDDNFSLSEKVESLENLCNEIKKTQLIKHSENVFRNLYQANAEIVSFRQKLASTRQFHADEKEQLMEQINMYTQSLSARDEENLRLHTRIGIRDKDLKKAQGALAMISNREQDLSKRFVDSHLDRLQLLNKNSQIQDRYDRVAEELESLSVELAFLKEDNVNDELSSKTKTPSAKNQSFGQSSSFAFKNLSSPRLAPSKKVHFEDQESKGRTVEDETSRRASVHLLTNIFSARERTVKASSFRQWYTYAISAAHSKNASSPALAIELSQTQQKIRKLKVALQRFQTPSTREITA